MSDAEETAAQFESLVAVVVAALDPKISSAKASEIVARARLGHAYMHNYPVFFRTWALPISRQAALFKRAPAEVLHPTPGLRLGGETGWIVALRGTSSGNALRKGETGTSSLISSTPVWASLPRTFSEAAPEERKSRRRVGESTSSTPKSASRASSVAGAEPEAKTPLATSRVRSLEQRLATAEEDNIVLRLQISRLADALKLAQEEIKGLYIELDAQRIAQQDTARFLDSEAVRLVADMHPHVSCKAGAVWDSTLQTCVSTATHLPFAQPTLVVSSDGKSIHAVAGPEATVTYEEPIPMSVIPTPPRGSPPRAEKYAAKTAGRSSDVDNTRYAAAVATPLTAQILEHRVNLRKTQPRTARDPSRPSESTLDHLIQSIRSLRESRIPESPERRASSVSEDWE